MRRALVVTSSYKPTAIADMHRARHLAWELPAAGWDVEVLFPGQAFQRPEFTEPGASWLFAPDTPLHPVAPTAARLFRLAGMRSISWRALHPLHVEGCRLLDSGRFDLVYITTGHFPLFALGPGWTRRTGVPYVLDFHDPWIRPDTGRQTTRSSVKRVVSNALAVRLERYAVEHAAGFVSVSPAYLAELRERYGTRPALSPDRAVAIPFAGSHHDFPPRPTTRAFTPGATRRIVYIGAGGAIMRRSVDTICSAMAQIRRKTPDLLRGLQILLAGTDGGWQDGGPRPLQDLAASYGLGDIVREEPRRITYTEAMALVQSSDGLLVLGVDDAGYVPSKLFTYALTGLPLLASLREDSPACAPFEQVDGPGELLRFAPVSRPSREPDTMTMRRFLAAVQQGQRRVPDRDALVPFMAPAMARRHARLFDTVVGQEREGSL